MKRLALDLLLVAFLVYLWWLVDTPIDPVRFGR